MPAIRRLHTLLALTFAVLALAAVATRAPAQPVPALRDHRWEHRVLVVFAPTGNAARGPYRAQVGEFARHADALAERDVVVLDFPPGADPGRAATLRRQLGVAGGAFGVVLVGKDGEVKLRRRALLSAERVLATVDGMPMGAAEARRRRGRA